VQVLCYELRCAVLRGALPAAAERIPAPNAELEHFFDHLERVLGQIGFFGTKAPTKVMRRLRRMYQRALPDARELAILRGILSETERAAGYKPGRRRD
jgi:tRNA C32,U32 (ribose-2'-O)-methylase TrmJ